jgi:hypothetical protein
VSLFGVLLAVHILLAVTLLLPSVVLPFVLRRSSGGQPTSAARALMALQGTGTLVIAAGLALTGIGLLVILGAQTLAQPWLIVALALYAANLAVAAFISRPNLRRLIGLGSGGDEQAWRRRARQQRYVAYGMAGVIGIIGFLMSTKPELW